MPHYIKSLLLLVFLSRFAFLAALFDSLCDPVNVKVVVARLMQLFDAYLAG